MKIQDYLNLNDLQKMVDEGYVDARLHRQYPLVIYCYSKKATYDNKWNDITCKCRGLIVNYDTREILARPFQKFFNLGTEWWAETMPENLPREMPMVLEKIDGSLGILYRIDGQDLIATKGSFHSEHSEWASQWYRMNVINGVWPEGWTPMFEIICQDVQRHVVNYLPEDDGLYLTAMINVETGEEMSYNELYHWAKINGVRVPRIFPFSVEQAAKENIANEEGYVLSWTRKGQTPLRVKVKFADFCRMQKVIHHTTPKTILEMIVNGQNFGELLKGMSPQFVTWVVKVKQFIETERKSITDYCTQVYNLAILKLDDSDRKQYAELFTRAENKPYSGILFSMLDGDTERARRNIFKMVESRLYQIGSTFEVADEDE
jgi:RNA ligase